jgi:UDP-glucose 4-epimerase
LSLLITGGAGYIGSTIASCCLDNGIEPIILDDLSTGSRQFVADRKFYEGDIADGDVISKIFSDHPDISCVIHCAARILVSEAMADPALYYETNVAKTVALIQHLLANGCDQLVFSSSAAVYGDTPGTVSEGSPVRPGNPYGRTKVICEEIIADIAMAGRLQAIALRYFNPVGADPSLRTGLQGRRPSHVLGGMIAAMQLGQPFVITGTDYPTRDGTGLRDYVHVWDVAAAHVAAVNCLGRSGPGSFSVMNIGSGEGTTVRELLAVFNVVSQTPIASVEGPSRPGDCAGSFAVCDRAEEMLGWKAQLKLADAVRDALAWARVHEKPSPLMDRSL